MITNAKYTESGVISAEIDEIQYFVPDDMSNRHRRMIAEWEAEGNTITPYVEPSAPIPDRVTANQFGKQLVELGIMNQVSIWISQQDLATQWSFNRSATFVRTDPMMQTGFAALGFTPEQIDAFFVEASKL